MVHHALQIQEILLNIFDHCRLRGSDIPTSDLPALARTCRAFKEPALDVLWGDLPSPIPLARCLPKAHKISEGLCYSFSRPLTHIEWSTLRNYTRRIVSIEDEDDEFDWESVRTFLHPPTTDPLLPNLRHLRATRSTGLTDLLSMPLPSLVSLCVSLGGNLNVFLSPLESIHKFSSRIESLSITLRDSDIQFSNFISNYICRWQNLRSIDCASVTLGMDALAHLSRMPALTQLAFEPSASLQNQTASVDSPLLFPDLHILTLYSNLLDSISWLLFRIRLPVVTEFTVSVECCPSKQDLSHFWDSIQTSAIHRTIKALWLIQLIGMHGAVQDLRPLLGFEDLQPCMAFRKLRRIEINIDWAVSLVDNKLLELASAWPHLELLSINQEYGWHAPGGITASGLLQLLQTCRSLSSIALAFDTRGYIGPPSSSAGLGLTLRPKQYLLIDVVDSIIEAKSVAAVGAFFAGLACHPNFSFRAWAGFLMDTAGCQHRRWYGVLELAIGTSAGILNSYSETTDFNPV